MSRKGSLYNLEEILAVEPEVLSRDQLEKARDAALKNGCSLFKSLLDEGIMSEETLLDILSKRLSLEKVNLFTQTPDKRAIRLVPAELAVKRCCVPVQMRGDLVQIAVNDPTDYQLFDELRLLLYTDQDGRAMEPVFCLAAKDDISMAIKNFYGLGAETAERLMIQSNLADFQDKGIAEDIDLVDTTVDGEPSVIQFVNMLLIEAVKNGATDIHIEPFERKLRIRQRIDGMLHEVLIPASMANFTSNIVSRIKVMAQLDIAEKRLPQDGRIKTRIKAEEYDLRISVLPGSYGEAVNLRILSQHMRFMSLDQLGLDQSYIPVVKDLIERPNGVILVTGPTGSGKTTFLYACLGRINTMDRKILTIEDPIEYRMDGVVQMQTLAKIDYSFARALRSMLRHDPDVMMIGEIRDTETAQITVRSALTGHLVFSTLHTNDAAGAIARLLDMGIEPFLAASSLLAVLAIRLVRILCPHCKRQVNVESSMLDQLGVIESVYDVEAIYEPVGCPQCRHTGFAGRTGICEILRITEPVRELIQRRVATGSIKTAAIAEGMKTLRQDGWRKIKAGITSVGEVLRMSHADELITTGG
ncbi:MAG: type II/IV secretion system protein [candidate division Zixibacteria bacterium]|nr:type II/IV secretion system protein [Phycisphaerae bacterium]NIR64388.1 type II/IV secretion system protein [candidate division Zixibacteria bacterium]NIP53579.1 type II/IV secretion system protein [Phycisphaerae bacterium]NIS52537.1 type II/IV secretion system protein [Phycisphaerae bacterium]NIU14394.1 type II/IV secretion system protein [candidate division Zixibacteria bacterium]